MSEQNPISVFVSHTFEESFDYLRIFEFLESVDGFYYLNVSKPENMPESADAQGIKDEVIAQIKVSEAVVILSSTYEEQPELVQFMMDAAEVNNKGMIGVRPFGGVGETPPDMLERCQENVEWNNREIADAITRQARGEDTARWEVLDFPGYNADGPTD